MLRLARISGGHLVKPPLVRQGQPGPVAQDRVQVTFACLQGCNAFSLSPLALVAKAESLAVLLLANSALGNQKLGVGWVEGRCLCWWKDSVTFVSPGRQRHIPIAQDVSAVSLLSHASATWMWGRWESPYCSCFSLPLLFYFWLYLTNSLLRPQEQFKSCSSHNRPLQFWQLQCHPHHSLWHQETWQETGGASVGLACSKVKGYFHSS